MRREIVELREVVTKLVPMLAGKGLRVTQIGSQAYVSLDRRTGKPTRVNIPNIPDDADEVFINAVQGFIDHEVGHVLITDFKIYGGSDKERRSVPFKVAQRRTHLHNIWEDTMIEREMVRIFPGSRKNIADMRRLFIDRITIPALEKAPDEQVQFGYLLVVVARALSGHEEFKEFMDKNDYWKLPLVAKFVNALPAQLKADLPKLRTTAQTWEVAKITDAILNPPKPPAPPQPKPQPQPEPPQEEEEQQEQGGNGESPEDENEGESQDKPDQEAGEGDGDGERDHSESEPGEEGDQEEDEEDADGADGAGGAAGDEPDDEGAGEDGDDEQDDTDTDAPAGSADGSENHDDAGEDQEKDSPAEGADAGSDADEPGEDEGGSASGADDDAEEEADSDQNQDGDDGDAGEGMEGAEPEDENGDGASGADADDADRDDDADEGASDDGDAAGEGADADDEGDDPSGSAGDGGDEPEEDEDGDTEEADGGGGSGEQDEVGEQTDQDAEQEEDDDSSGIGGGGEADSMFDLPEGALEAADLSKAIAGLLEKQAIDLMRGSEYNVLTREGDRIEILQVPPDRVDDKDRDGMDPKWVPELEDKVRSMTGRMAKDIERMMASRSFVVRTPGFRSGRLHAPNLHRLMTGDERVFNRRQEYRSLETAVELVIDNSGSMSGDKIMTAMTAGFALSMTLERVKIAHEVIGFTTGNFNHLPADMQRQINEEARGAYWGAGPSGVVYHRVSPIVMPIYKTFDERLTGEVKRRFAYVAYAQKNLANNIDGESLEYAAIRLMRRPEKRKVMIVLSDGYPAGATHAPDHLAVVVPKLIAAGIDMVGIGIESDAVENFYPDFAVLNDVEELPGQIMTRLKQILA